MSHDTAPDPNLTPAGRDALLREIETLRAAGDEIRAARLRDVVRRATIVAPDPAGLTTIGSRVTVEDDTGALHEYTLTSTHDPSGRGAASVSSPVGQALLGRAPGTTVTVELPNGRTFTLRVLAIDEQQAA